MIRPEGLELECVWYTVIKSNGFCTKPRGDWHSCPHLASAKAWRESMLEPVQAFSSFMESYQIYPQCPIHGCNTQGTYVDHVTSTNGSHFKNLYQKGIHFVDDCPIEELRETAWQQINLPKGAVRINHIDWEVRMWKGTPPPAPIFGHHASWQTSSISLLSNTSHQVTTICVCPNIAYNFLAQLPEDNRWFQLHEPASVPTTDYGGWQSVPHFAGGRRHWGEHMKSSVTMMARLLSAYSIQYLACSMCNNGKGFDEHIGGKVHWDQVWLRFGERPFREVKEELWQECLLRNGSGLNGIIRFSHLDGEIQMLREVSTNATSTLAGRPVLPFSTVELEGVTLQSTLSELQSFPAHHTSASSLSTRSPPPPPPSDLSPWTKLLWQRVVLQAVPALQAHLDSSEVSTENLTCQVCFNAVISEPLQHHFCSEDHMRNLETIVSSFSREHFASTEVLGKQGCCVQNFRGEKGIVWFNHITCESHVELSNKVVPKWEKYTYCVGEFWWNRQSGEYFQVCGEYGLDKGIWRC